MTATILILLALVAVGTPALGSRLPYIIGGDDVTDNTKYPWQGSLRTGSGSHTCGCALISSTWAVTAAHCVGSTGYRVMFGSTSRTSQETVRDVADVIKHEDYGSGSGSFPNDIAVLKFAAVTLGSTVDKIDIIKSDPAGNDDDCYITGWGRTRTGGSGGLPDQLQEAKINVYTNTECEVEWGSFRINAGHICIGDSTNGRGSCNGDSGGPLVCNVGNGYELVGVTSWGINGCYTSYPSVYTRLTHFRQWITDKTGV